MAVCAGESKRILVLSCEFAVMAAARLMAFLAQLGIVRYRLIDRVIHIRTCGCIIESHRVPGNTTDIPVVEIVAYPALDAVPILFCDNRVCYIQSVIVIRW